MRCGIFCRNPVLTRLLMRAMSSGRNLRATKRMRLLFAGQQCTYMELISKPLLG